MADLVSLSYISTYMVLQWLLCLSSHISCTTGLFVLWERFAFLCWSFEF